MAEAELASRRQLLSRISLTLSAAAAAVVAIPIVSYLLSPLINPTPPDWIDLGPVDAESGLRRPVAAAVGRPDGPHVGLAPPRRAGRLRRLRGQLHPPRLPRQLAARRRPLPLSVPRRRLQRGRNGRWRAAPPAAAPIRGARPEQQRPDPDAPAPGGVGRVVPVAARNVACGTPTRARSSTRSRFAVAPVFGMMR